MSHLRRELRHVSEMCRTLKAILPTVTPEPTEPARTHRRAHHQMQYVGQRCDAAERHVGDYHLHQGVLSYNDRVVASKIRDIRAIDSRVACLGETQLFIVLHGNAIDDSAVSSGVQTIVATYPSEVILGDADGRLHRYRLDSGRWLTQDFTAQHSFMPSGIEVSYYPVLADHGHVKRCWRLDRGDEKIEPIGYDSDIGVIHLRQTQSELHLSVIDGDQLRDIYTLPQPVLGEPILKWCQFIRLKCEDGTRKHVCMIYSHVNGESLSQYYSCPESVIKAGPDS